MMRDIKFRCWDTGINYMYYDTDCYNIYNENDNGVHSGYEDKYGQWHQNKLMQYTGLKDKNGTPIYEGDIVKDKRGDFVSINKVIYREDKAKFTFNGWDIPSNIDKWCEVIGNIYENPELLESPCN